MIFVKYFPNILSHEKRETVELPYSRNSTIKDFIKLAGIDLKNKRVVVSGKGIENLNRPVDNGDEILVLPDIGVDPVTWAAMTTIGKILTVAKIVAVAASITYSIVNAVTSRPRKSNFGSASQGLDEGSPTYDWDGIQTIQEVGVPVPDVYGEHKVGGNIINNFIWTDGDKNYLNVLLGLCEGEIKSISDIKINDNPIANFQGATTFQKLGTNSQTVIPNFSDLHNVYNINAQLTKNNPYTHLTNNTDVEAFEIHLQLPSGLFQQDQNSGAIEDWSVTYKVEYKLYTAGTWTDLGNTTISYKSRSTVRRTFRKESLTAGQYDIRITRVSDDSDFYHTGDLYLLDIDEIQTDDLSYPNTALLGLKLLATDQLSGSMPNITCIVKGRKIKVPKVMNGAAEVDWEDYYWDPATSQYKLLSDNTVLSWDGSTYVNKYCANPAWCLYDLLINDRYGLGEFIEESHLDLALFVEMSQYCEEKLDDGVGSYEKRFRLDVVIDSSTRALDLIIQLSAAFRGLPFYSEGAIKLRIDKIETPIQLFGMGNIIKDSFSQSYKSIREVPNVIEVQFLDKDKDFKQETIAVIDEAALAAGDSMRKQQIRIFTTRMSQAIREGRYALWVSKYITKTVSFKAGIDAVAIQAGDVFNFSHDVPQWGFSGRVISGTVNYVILDKEVTLEVGKTYKVMIRFSDDTTEERTVSNSSGTYKTLNVSSAFSQAPQVYDVYAFGENNKVVKPFRSVSIQRENRNEINIMAIEYNASVFDDSGVVLPTNNYSALSLEIPDVLSFEVTERLVQLKDGTLENVIDVWFGKPTQDNYFKRYAKAKIFLSEDNGVSWVLRGETTSEHFAIQGDIKDLNTYKIAVVSVSDKGEENAIEDSPQDTIQVLGKTAPPSNVTGFEVFQEGNLLRFSWDAISDVDLSRYVIKKGSEWSTGQVIAELVDTTDYMYPVGEIGEVTFMVKAVDTSGNESTAPDIDLIDIAPPPEMNFINDFDLWNVNLEYKLSNIELVFRNDYNSNYVRPCFALRTTTTWEEREAEGQTWEYQEANNGLILDRPVESSGYFEMIKPIDLGTIFEFKIIVDADYKNVAGGSLTVQISYSEDDSSYSSFADVSANATYRARYVKFKFILATTDTNFNIYFYGCTLFINAPVTKVAWGKDVAIPVGGKTIQFGVEFSYPPRVIANVINGVGYVKRSSKTKDSFFARVYDYSTHNPIGTGEIDWEGKGY